MYIKAKAAGVRNRISQLILIFLRTPLNPVGVTHWALG